MRLDGVFVADCRRWVSALTLLIAAGCVSPGRDDAKGDDDTDEARDTSEHLCEQMTLETDDVGNLLVPVTDAMNMTFRSELTIAVETLKAGSDFTIDWSELSVDMLGQDIDPLQGVDRLQMVVWRLPEAELLSKLNNDDLAMADVEAPGMVLTNNERTSVSYLEMTSPAGAPIEEETLLNFVDPDQYDPEHFTYTVMVAVGTHPELGFKMLHLLRFDADEENTEVRITNGATTLDYEVDIASSDDISLPSGNSSIVIDWADSLDKNALGNPFIPPKIWYVNVAHYPDMEVSDLEANFLDIEYIAKKRYRVSVESGFSVHLSTLVDEAGEPFPGINREGTWIVALMCGDCANPAPWFLSVLRPCIE